MNKDILLVIETVSNEKGVSKDVIFEAMESALATATKKLYSEDVDISVTINRDSGEYETFRCWTVIQDDDESERPDAEWTVEQAKQKSSDLEVGDNWKEKIDNIEFGRIAAQIAKQVIVQKVREAEREEVVKTYEKKVGELINGAVKKVTRDNIIVDLGNNAEGILARDQLIPREVYRVNDRVRSLLLEIKKDIRGPQIILSRTCPEMLIELFKIEVPEIAEEVIEIRAAARDSGSRAKVAVKTNDGRIDPVGACVGMRGSRVQAVSNELDNERIDIILWDDNPAQLVINALAPAEIASIVVDEETNTMDVAVTEENLAQAIGRSGQNVRLASELTNWTINVMTSEEATQKLEQETSSIVKTFVDTLGVDDDLASLLVTEGLTSLEELAYIPLEEMLAVEELDEDTVKELRSRAKNALITQALTSEEHRDKNQPAEDLLNLEGITPDIAQQLASNGIITREDLAEQAVDELTDVIDISSETAAELIMKARAHWFEEQESNETPSTGEANT